MHLHSDMSRRKPRHIADRFRIQAFQVQEHDLPRKGFS
jgi:hypothetical protein